MPDLMHRFFVKQHNVGARLGLVDVYFFDFFRILGFDVSSKDIKEKGLMVEHFPSLAQGW